MIVRSEGVMRAGSSTLDPIFYDATMHQKGVTLLQLGRISEATACFSHLLEHVLRSDSGVKDITIRARRLARAHLGVGKAQAASSDFELALASCQAALSVLGPAPASTPSCSFGLKDADVRSAVHFDTATNLRALGGRSPEVVDHFERSLALLLRFPAPGTFELIEGFACLAKAHTEAGRLKEATETRVVANRLLRRSQNVCAGPGCGRALREDGTPLTVCTGCDATHYCSVVCQRGDWELQHRAECAALVAAAAAVAPAVARCAGPGCVRMRRGDGAPLDQCAGCLHTHYCGKACQTAHWKGGQRAECKAMVTGGRAAAAVKPSNGK